MTNNSDAIEGIKSGAQLAITNFTLPAIDLFLTQNKPEWAVPWMVIRGFFGFLFAFQQEKINWFVQYLQENKEEFSKEILESSEFQEGFVLTFENYIKQRGEKRRKIIEEIFLDFTKAVDKESFELERLYRTSELISLESVQFISFILEKVSPDILSSSQAKKASQIDISELLGRFFERDNNKASFADLFVNHLEYVAELTTLGILTNRAARGITYAGGSQMSFGFTEFGLRFIKYVMNLQETK